MKSIKSEIKETKGEILAYIIIIFFFLSIITASVMSLFYSNLLQAKKQQSHMEAYYLAYSGAQMGFAAIIENNNELLKKIEEYGDTYTEGDIVFGEGKIDIVASKSEDERYPGWIKIVSTGSLNDDNTSVTRTLYIDPDNQNNIKWENK